MIEIYDGEQGKKNEEIEKKESAFKKEKEKEKVTNKIESPKPPLRKTQSVFDSLTSDTSP